MRIAAVSTSLVILGVSQWALAQSKEKWPKPEVMVAPVYPRTALGRGIQVVVTVSADVDRYGNVTRANAVETPCRYSTPSPDAGAPACDFAREAEIHRATADRCRNESLDQSLPEATRKAKYKEFDTEYWLAAQFEVYAAAEQAARQWIFQSVRPATPPGHHVIDLTFRFSRGDSAFIQVIDPWTIAVTGALYPAPDD